MLRKTRPEAEEFARERPAEATPTGENDLLDDTMDPLVTAVPTVILHAATRYGGKLQVLADDQRLLTDDKLDVLEPRSGGRRPALGVRRCRPAPHGLRGGRRRARQHPAYAQIGLLQ
ncbi:MULTISPECIES: hypothetical protein [Streptomyces]|uniref:hypothetical protein n=1 Tax=Streptomyces TaxID=1883 RepID=UPI003723CA70